jgi:hypothetical protein
MKRSDTVASLTNQDRLPRDIYRLRVLSAVFGQSSKGNPMITLEWEILSDKDGNDSVQIGDRKVTIAGKRITQWFPVLVKDADGNTDQHKTGLAQGRVFDLYEKCGHQLDEIDENNPDVRILVNCVVEAVLYSAENTKFKDPTPEQRAAGARVGDVIKDANGQPVKVFQPAIDMIVGPVS